VELDLAFTTAPYRSAVVGGAWEDAAPAAGGYPELDEVTVAEVRPIADDGRRLPSRLAEHGTLSRAECERWRRAFTEAYANGPFGRLRDDVDERCMEMAEQ
jgi:hypothetical protein